MVGKHISLTSLSGKHVSRYVCGETRVPSDMCAGKYDSRGNTIHGETHITVTPAWCRGGFRGVSEVPETTQDFPTMPPFPLLDKLDS